MMPRAAAPSYIQVEPTTACNLRCRMCPAAGTSRRAFMPYALFTRIVDQAAGAERLHLQGLGEPLLHPRFFDMAAYAATRGIRVTTNTNLTVLDEGQAGRCIDSGLDTLYVSVDAASAMIYEIIRTNARFEQLVRNLELLMRERARRGSARPRIVFATVAMRCNLHELRGIVAFAASHGVPEIFVQHLSRADDAHGMPGEYFRRQNLTDEYPERVSTYFAGAREAAVQAGIALHLPRVRPAAEASGRCDWPDRGIYVDVRGAILPCCMMPAHSPVRFGTVRGRGMRGVFSDTRYRGFCAALASGEPPAVCRGCSIYRGVF
jgi:MoaA/NifB/PqqE/SkfB family radical SAM enzyme